MQDQFSFRRYDSNEGTKEIHQIKESLHPNKSTSSLGLFFEALKMHLLELDADQSQKLCVD